MNNRQKVSVIVPVYNGESTIARCINSILNQTLTDLELIIIDDGSADKTGEICTAYDDDRIRYYRKENGGPSSARNMGLSLASGEYIGFVDADDGIVPEMYEKMYAACKKHDADLCVCDYQFISTETGKGTNYTDFLRGGYFTKAQIQDEVMAVFLGNLNEEGHIGNVDWGVMRRIYRRSFVQENSLHFDETLCNSEDCLFCFMATKQANGLVYLKNEHLYINYRNPWSLTRKYLPDFWTQRCQVMDTLASIIEEDRSAWDTPGFVLMVMRGVRPSFTNIAYGFGKVSIFHSLMEFRTIVHDPRVRKMCAAVNPEGFNDEWSKLFNWCYHKRWITLYLYHMDVIQHNKLCHLIRTVQKALERRLHR